MKQVKNPLRQLASDIVTACRQDNAKGVKHSTVLTALTKHHGYRSHQASDSASQKFKVTPQMIFLQGMIYQAYPSADLCPGEFNAIAGRKITAEECGDALYAWLLNSVLLIKANKLAEYIMKSYEEVAKEFIALPSYEAVEALPVGECELRDFLRAEVLECVEKDAQGEVFQAQLEDRLERVEYEMGEVSDAIAALPEWFLGEA